MSRNHAVVQPRAAIREKMLQPLGAGRIQSLLNCTKPDGPWSWNVCCLQAEAGSAGNVRFCTHSGVLVGSFTTACCQRKREGVQHNEQKRIIASLESPAQQ
eukprot:TRINITY_DN2481_c0_g1_i2.p2 TRINITY_DN2481_c0_g1~~TRINITY_DN2481_c0_g1_i2.p2  ORF type:complete len:101 (+),score=2.99 TRINITY_DN2481_c0_g1_i2:1296-1598(+)